MRRYALLLAAIAAIAGNAHAESELVIAIRYLHAQGTSHSHLYLYREDGTLGRETESHSLRARKIRCALLRDVNVSTRPHAGRDHVAPKLGVRTNLSMRAKEESRRNFARTPKYRRTVMFRFAQHDSLVYVVSSRYPRVVFIFFLGWVFLQPSKRNPTHWNNWRMISGRGVRNTGHSQPTTSIGWSDPAGDAIGLGRVLTSEEKIWPDLKHAGRN